MNERDQKVSKTGKRSRGGEVENDKEEREPRKKSKKIKKCDMMEAHCMCTAMAVPGDQVSCIRGETYQEISTYHIIIDLGIFYQGESRKHDDFQFLCQEWALFGMDLQKAGLHVLLCKKTEVLIHDLMMNIIMSTS